ncbi:hypothetical protein M5K25_001621 [Dendrobium thyrsiflorum]|uniref:Uncharacterized protein n=1 Tax=Dendrobium thyrsiflorum TaxID=117978 RepID=A0ABD0VQT1_DENTH
MSPPARYAAWYCSVPDDVAAPDSPLDALHGEGLEKENKHASIWQSSGKNAAPPSFPTSSAGSLESKEFEDKNSTLSPNRASPAPVAPEQGRPASTMATERSDSRSSWRAMESPMIPAPTTTTSCSECWRRAVVAWIRVRSRLRKGKPFEDWKRSRHSRNGIRGLEVEIRVWRERWGFGRGRPKEFMLPRVRGSTKLENSKRGTGNSLLAG